MKANNQELLVVVVVIGDIRAWLAFTMDRSNDWRKKNEVMLVKSDKGNHLVVMEPADYDKKMALALAKDFTTIDEHTIKKIKRLRAGILGTCKSRKILTKQSGRGEPTKVSQLC